MVSAPAGTGKSTLIEMLLNEFPDKVVQSCSCTTRSARPGEVAKQHYHFISIAEFEAKIKEEAFFLEHVKIFGNYYGTAKEEIRALRKQGKHVVMVIDTQGAMQIKEKEAAIFIFILPPSLEELRRRLFKRRTENEEKIEERLSWAEKEIEMVPSYDYQIINDNLDNTYQILRSIIIAEEHKTRK